MTEKNENMSSEIDEFLNRIIEKAISDLPQTREIKGYPKSEELLFNILPEISKDYTKDGIPFIRFRLRKYEKLALDVVYFPQTDVRELSEYIITRLSNVSLEDDERKHLTIGNFEIVTRLLILGIKDALEVSHDSVLSKVKATFDRDVQTILSIQGNKTKKVSSTKNNKDIFESYSKKAAEFWDNYRNSVEKNQKRELAKEYPAIYKHWKLLRHLYRDGADWQSYAKAGKFSNTPDDLLNKMLDTEERKLSEIAIEHAARHVGILKTSGVKESDLAKRKKGVIVTGYSTRQLFKFLEEGEKDSK